MDSMSATPLRPTLVCMSWRGGARLRRCLESISRSRDHFDRCIVSITGSRNGEDMRTAAEFQGTIRDLEVICTDRELPTMKHQEFWVDYLENSGSAPSDWIFWLAHDDEVRPRGIKEVIDGSGNWPLQADTAYFGPWAMRHESASDLWHGDQDAILESWTSLPQRGPNRLRIETWIRQQLLQPTYMQMSGSVNPLRSFIRLRDSRPRKKGPMRIEMAIAADPYTQFVEEFASPVSIVYGRPNSDRSSYGASARAEDFHLGVTLARYSLRNPMAFSGLVTAAVRLLGDRVAGKAPREEWRIRGHVQP
jgi:hypothetical protein